MRRVIAGRLEGAPHETLLVVDATTGQNGLQQARLFGEAVEVTGVALTKLDGSAKGGIAVPIAYELGLPVKLIGVGEKARRPAPVRPGRLRAGAGRRVAATGGPRSAILALLTGAGQLALGFVTWRSSSRPSPVCCLRSLGGAVIGSSADASEGSRSSELKTGSTSSGSGSSASARRQRSGGGPICGSESGEISVPATRPDEPSPRLRREGRTPVHW